MCGRHARFGLLSALRMSLREAFCALTERAADAGYPEADRLGQLTLAEIRLRLTAFAAQKREMWERADAQAWLTGRYTALALCAPAHYPERPEGLKTKPRTMNEEEMKAVFVAMKGGSADECH